MKVRSDIIYIKTRTKNSAERIKNCIKEEYQEAVVGAYKTKSGKGLFIGYLPNCTWLDKIQMVCLLRLIDILYWFKEKTGISL